MKIHAGNKAGIGDEKNTMLENCKPENVQNMKNQLGNRGVVLDFDEPYIEKNSIWFIPRNETGVFRYDIDTKKLELIADITSCNGFLQDEFAALSRYENKFILAPRAGDYIVIYNINAQKASYIRLPMPEDCTNINMWTKFNSIVSYKQYMYLIPDCYPMIIKVNMLNEKIKVINEWADEIRGETWMYNQIEPLLAKDVVVEDNIFYAASFRTNKVMKFTLEEDSYEIIRIGERKGGFCTLCKTDTAFWLTLREGTIEKWTIDKNQVTHLSFPEALDEGQYKYFPYRCSVFSNGYVWLFPDYANMVLKVNITSNEFEPLELLEDRDTGWKFSFARIRGQTVYAYSCLHHALYRYDLISGKLEGKSPVIYNIMDVLTKHYADAEKKNYISFFLPEQNDMTINDLAYYLENINDLSNFFNTLDLPIKDGKRIYNTIKNISNG